MFDLQNMLRIVERSTREEDRSRELRMVGSHTCELRCLHVRLREAADRGAVNDDKSVESRSMENIHERRITFDKQLFKGATANPVAVGIIDTDVILARRFLPNEKQPIRTFRHSRA